MAASEYRIRVKRGHHARLRFWFDPMSDDIWNGDADLIMEDELSCDNICTHELFFPIIERFFPGDFRWRNELNLMPMEDVKDMIDEIRDLIDILDAGDIKNKRLNYLREGYAVDLLVPEDEYMENYYGRPQRVQVQGVIDHLHVISEFYQTIADYLDEMVDKYEPKGFKYIAISAPV